MCAVIALARDGLFLESVPASTTAIDHLVQQYSFYCGTLAAAATTPAHMWASMMVPVLAMVVRSPSEIHTPTSKAVLLAFKLLIVLSITAALNSVNVQSGGSRIHPQMSAIDLQPLTQTSASISSNALSSPHSSSNTVLRSAIYGLNTEVDLQCSQPHSNVSSVTDARVSGMLRPVVQYAFTPKPWLESVVPVAKAPSATVMFNQSSAQNDQLPFENSVAEFLVRQLSAQAGLNASNASHLTISQAIQHAVNQLERQQSGQQLTLSRFQLSADVEFLSALWEAQDGRWLQAMANVYDATHSHREANATQTTGMMGVDVDVHLECSATGCVFPMPRQGHAGDFESSFRVVAFPIACSDVHAAVSTKFTCEAGTVQNAFGVMATSQYVTGDGIVVTALNESKESSNEDEYLATAAFASHHVRLRNAVVLSTQVVGILRWQVSDLAARFEAACMAGNTSCNGLSYALEDNTSRVLIVGEQQLPITRLHASLALIKRSTGKGSWPVLRRDNFKTADWPSTVVRGEYCTSAAEDYVEYMEQNHLALEHTEQEAYTAAMFYMLDHARIYDRVNNTVDGEATTLNFDGNVHFAHFGVVIPQQAATVSVVATGALLLLSLLTAMIASRSEDSSTPRPGQVHHVTVHRTAEVIFDEAAYPAAFVQGFLTCLEEADASTAMAMSHLTADVDAQLLQSVPSECAATQAIHDVRVTATTIEIETPSSENKTTIAWDTLTNAQKMKRIDNI